MKNRCPKAPVSALAVFAAAVAAVSAAAPVASAHAAASLGPHAERCAPGATDPAVQLTITGFKDREGQLRIKAFNGEGDDFLKSGKYLIKFDVPVSSSGDMTVCVPLPGGHARYAISVLHDRDMDGKTDLWSDGFGVSNNPKLKFSKPKPGEVAFAAPQAVGVMRIVLNYVSGLNVGPIRKSE